VPDGIIAHLTRECGWNVHERQVVKVMSGSFGRESRSTAGALQNIVEMEAGSELCSTFRSRNENFLAERTIGCAIISDERELCQHTAQYACKPMVPAVLI
jgi:hypothetical protein